MSNEIFLTIICIGDLAKLAAKIIMVRQIRLTGHCYCHPELIAHKQLVSC